MMISLGRCDGSWGTRFLALVLFPSPWITSLIVAPEMVCSCAFARRSRACCFLVPKLLRAMCLVRLEPASLFDRA